jgi:hypothetical protein
VAQSKIMKFGLYKPIFYEKKTGIFLKKSIENIIIEAPIFACSKVGWPLDVAWQNTTLQIFICFHHFFVPFEKKKR